MNKTRFSTKRILAMTDYAMVALAAMTGSILFFAS